MMKSFLKLLLILNIPLIFINGMVLLRLAKENDPSNLEQSIIFACVFIYNAVTIMLNVLSFDFTLDIMQKYMKINPNFTKTFVIISLLIMITITVNGFYFLLMY